MRNFRRLVLGLVLVTLVTPLKAETVMYCVGELAVGFIRDNGNWRKGNFDANRYTIKFNYAYTRLSGLQKSDTFKCVDAKIGSENIITCRSEFDTGESFGLNRNTGRFFYSYVNLFGSISERSEPDTDNLEIGTCTKF